MYVNSCIVIIIELTALDLQYKRSVMAFSWAEAAGAVTRGQAVVPPLFMSLDYHRIFLLLLQNRYQVKKIYPNTAHVTHQT